MFNLTYSAEPVFFRGANRAPSLYPQPISHDCYGIYGWRKLVCNGCSEVRNHRAPFVLLETSWKWLVRSKGIGLEARKTAQLLLVLQRTCGLRRFI